VPPHRGDRPPPRWPGLRSGRGERMAAQDGAPIHLPSFEPPPIWLGSAGDLLAWTGGRSPVAPGRPFRSGCRWGERSRGSSVQQLLLFPGLGFAAWRWAPEVSERMVVRLRKPWISASRAARIRGPADARLSEVAAVAEPLAESRSHRGGASGAWACCEQQPREQKRRTAGQANLGTHIAPLRRSEQKAGAKELRGSSEIARLDPAIQLIG